MGARTQASVTAKDRSHKWYLSHTRTEAVAIVDTYQLAEATVLIFEREVDLAYT